MSAVLPDLGLRTSYGIVPGGAGTRLAQAAQGVLRLRAVPRGGGIDFMWTHIGTAAAPLLLCLPSQLLGRYMSEGRAGTLDHPALAQRYRRICEQGTPQSFEQVHRIAGQQHLMVHRVVPLGEGVEVTLINLSAERHARLARRSGRARVNICQLT